MLAIFLNACVWVSVTLFSVFSSCLNSVVFLFMFSSSLLPFHSPCQTGNIAGVPHSTGILSLWNIWQTHHTAQQCRVCHPPSHSSCARVQRRNRKWELERTYHKFLLKMVFQVVVRCEESYGEIVNIQWDLKLDNTNEGNNAREKRWYSYKRS